MKNKIHDALEIIKAEEQLKQNTYVYLLGKMSERQKKKPAVKQLVAAFAAIALFFVVGLISYNVYFTESAFVDIDVNPSIEITLNRFDRVIATYAYNSDGQKILDETNIANKEYGDALRILIGKMVEMGYIDNSDLFTATLQTDGEDAQERLTSLKDCINSTLRADGKTIEQDVFYVDNAVKASSHEQNLTPAKYLAILELQALDSTVTFDECRGCSISEIKQQVHDHADREHDSTSEGNDSNKSSDDEHHGGVGENDGHNQADSHGGGQDNSSPKDDDHYSTNEPESNDNHSNSGSEHDRGKDKKHRDEH